MAHAHQHGIEADVVRFLLAEGALESQPVRLSDVSAALPGHSSGAVRETVDSMAEGETPVAKLGRGPHANVYLDSYEAAKRFLAERGESTEWY